jgi:hypothetical protein
MKKLLILPLVFPLLGLSSILAQTVTLIGENFVTSEVKFSVDVPPSTLTWVFVDYNTSPQNPAGMARATFTEVTFNPIGAGTFSESGTWTANGQGFRLANSATVTAKLKGVSGMFSWCAIAISAPPNAEVKAGGGYTLRGTRPFTINNSITVDSYDFGPGTCINSITDLTYNPAGFLRTPPMTVTASASGATVCAGSALTFTATATGGTTTAMNYTWNIAGQTHTTTSNTYSRVLSTPGAATYTVFVTNANGCTSTISPTGTVTVNAVPVVNEVSSATICYGAKAALSATVSNATTLATYTWNIQGQSQTTTPTSTYTTPGLTATATYTVRITNATGCTSTVSGAGTITVYNQFSPGAIATTGQTLCVDGTPTVIGNSTAATGGNGTYSYSWYKDGSASSISGATANSYTPPTSDATVAGAHTYTRKVRDESCSTTTVQSTGSWVLTVLADPTITIAAAQTICYNTPGSALTATVTGGSGANTYTWKWGVTSACSDGSSTSTGNTLATGNLTASRYYQVMTTQAVSGCTSTYSGTVLKTVYAEFKAGAIATTGQTLCVGGTPTVIGNSTAASGGDGAFSYTWYKNGNVISGATATAYTPSVADASATGTNTYTRKVRDGVCNMTPEQSTGSWVLTVLADPTVTIAAAQTICHNTAGSALTATVSGGSGANTYTWKWGSTTACNDGTSTSTGNTLATGNLTASRYYQVMTTQAVSGCASTYSGTVLKTVYAQFKAGNIATTGQTICYGATVSAISSSTAASGGNGTISYEWRRNGTAIASTNAAAYTPTAFNSTAGANTFTRWAHDVNCNSAWTQSTGQWVLTVRPQFTPGAINTTDATTQEWIAPSTNPTNQTPASGGYGSITYEWRRSGTVAKTLENSNSADYTVSSDASNYGLRGTYYFNRYAKDGLCNTDYTASAGNYTLTVTTNYPPGATSAQSWGPTGYEFSWPINLPGVCTRAITTNGKEGTARYVYSDDQTMYYYMWTCAVQMYETWCPSPWSWPKTSDMVALTAYGSSAINRWGAGGVIKSTTWVNRSDATHLFLWYDYDWMHPVGVRGCWELYAPNGSGHATENYPSWEWACRAVCVRHD